MDERVRPTSGCPSLPGSLSLLSLACPSLTQKSRPRSLQQRCRGPLTSPSCCPPHHLLPFLTITPPSCSLPSLLSPPPIFVAATSHHANKQKSLPQISVHRRGSPRWALPASPSPTPTSSQQHRRPCHSYPRTYTQLAQHTRCYHELVAISPASVPFPALVAQG